MRIIFMGTPEFAVPSLDILIKNGYEVAAVITAADKPGGRHGIIQSAVKQYAVDNGLRLFQPEKLKNEAFLAELKALQADLQVVVAFRMLPEVVWNMPPMGTLNLHGSLLPRYRGAAPINWAVINGDTETGVTTFLLQHEIDTGDLLMQETTPIGPDDTAGEIHDRMMYLGAELVLKTVQALENKTIEPKPQTDISATHAPKIFTETCRIDFNQSAQQVHNFVRGLSPYPGAWTMLDDKVLKIIRTRLSQGDTAVTTPPGTVHVNEHGQLVVAAIDAYIEILELKLEGKRQMSARDFINGHFKKA